MKPQNHSNQLHRFAFAATLALILASSLPLRAATFSDDFSAQLRPTCWSISQTTSNLYSVDASQGNVHLAKILPTPGGFQGVFVDLSPMPLGGAIAGDFSTQIDFGQAVVPGPGLDQIEFHAYFQDGSIFYTVYDRSSGLNVHVWNGSSVRGTIPVSTDSGTFRIARIGSTVTGYFNGTTLSSETRSSALTGIAFALQNNQGSDDTTSVTFDNFSLTAPSTPPTLTIVAAGPQQVQVTWTPNSLGYLLEQTASLATPAWEAVTNIPSFTNNRFLLKVDAGAPQRFFRLRQQ